MSILFFFFFKQKTAYEITYGDWSSDVCSSDLGRWRRASSPGRAPPTTETPRGRSPRYLDGRGACPRRAAPGARPARAEGHSWNRAYLEGGAEHSRRDPLVNHLIQALALLPGGERGPAERAGGQLRERPDRAAVPRALARRQDEVLGALHPHELRGEVE